MYKDTNYCINALGGKNFGIGDTSGLFPCTYSAQEELQFGPGGALPAKVYLSARSPASKQLSMVPKHCAGKTTTCKPPNGDKVVGAQGMFEGPEWDRV